MFMFYLFHYNKTGKISSLYKGTMCLRMFHRCCIVSPLIRRMAGLGISFHILVLYVSLLIHQIPEVEHLQEFPKPGCHLDFFGKWKKNSLQQFGNQLSIFGNLANSWPPTPNICAREKALPSLSPVVSATLGAGKPSAFSRARQETSSGRRDESSSTLPSSLL